MATTNPALPPGEPVDPSQAQGAQIPLQSFTLPNFPSSARGLRALTLTSDLKLDEYQSQLAEPFTIPPLPSSIESLTLELFSLGYPVGWLTQLAARLPYTKSLVVYSQLLGGTGDESEKDAVQFFRRLDGLRALHLLDVFVRKGFWESIARYVTYDAGAEELPANGESRVTEVKDGEDNAEGPNRGRRGLMFLEINYTVQSSDPTFLSKVQATELPKLIGPGLITAALNVSEAEETDDPDDPANNLSPEEKAERQDGVVAFNKTLAGSLVKALTEEETRPVNLRVLNATLYTLGLGDLEKVLKLHKGVMVLIVTVEVDEADECRKSLTAILGGLEKIEQVEVVVNPSLQFFMAINSTRSTAMEKAFPSKTDMEELTKKCPKLSSFKANILRSKKFGTVEWESKDSKWTGGVKSNASA